MATSPSFDLSPPLPSQTDPPIPVRVLRYDPAAEPGEDGRDRRYSTLPNVRCVNVAEREGAEPATARFAYILDDTLARDAGWPGQWEDLWPMNSAGNPLRVEQGDRLIVVAHPPDGSLRLLFDGFADTPQVDVASEGQQVTFAATSVEIRCWDEPIGGRFQRDADDPEAGEDRATGLPTRFNPEGKANATPQDADAGLTGDFPAPAFLEQVKRLGPPPQTLWTLSRACRYILAAYNRDQEFVDNPDFEVMDDLLNNRRPAEGSEWLDGIEYESSPITLGDYDATNRPWPEVVAELLGYYGFGFRVVHEWDAGSPSHWIEMYRRDQDGPTEPKELRLPRVGASLGFDYVDVSGFNAAHDFRGLANEIEVETDPGKCEVSIVLAPGFEIDAADATAPNDEKWLKTKQADASDADRDKYRVYVADECGDGHWSFAADDWALTPLDLASVFPDVENDDEEPVRGYVRRYRPGARALVSLGPDKKPLKAVLHFSRDYEGTEPGVWDGTGHWQPIAGSWELLDDRLGVRLTAEDLRAWKIGDYKGPDPQESGTTLDAIKSIAAPDPTKQPLKRFALRLTTVIESDFGLDAVAEKRAASPSPFTISRRVEARDVYRRSVVHPSSPFYDDSDPDALDLNANQIVRDDSAKALTKAAQIRSSREFPPIAAAVAIPRLDFSLQIGDRVSRINGREVSLQVNAGSEAGESPSYPFVTARTLDLAGDRQTTTLQLSDRRMEVAPTGRRT